ncbi:alpha/beta hydrolase [Phytohabitans sp. LJ34]|uniref:alpha/beta hydrolase n=1 Tax=Phytohabitans sp. LJ34 TaxID=3452217 RepID=UPI003F8A82F7
MADAVVIPGRLYGPGAPLPMYAGDVAERRGATLHRFEWSRRSPDPFQPSIEQWVADEVTPVLDRLGGRPLLIGKSLGTHAATLAADRSLPAVWLTPVLTVPWVVDALGRATAPFMLVGGTADKLWDSAVARRLTPHVFEVADADHGMYVPGPLTDSVTLLARVVVAVDDFLTKIAWPA